MRRLDILQGTLNLERSYAMAGDSSYYTVVNRDGSHGQLSVEGTAALDGELAVSKGPGLFFNGMTFDILTADAVQGQFASVVLPAPKKLLSFGLRQSTDRVQIVTLAKSFTAAATDPVEMAVAEYLDRIQYTVSGDLLDILSQIQNLDDSGFGQAFHSLSPYSYDQYTAASFIGAQQNVQSVQHRMSSVRTHTLAAGSTRKSEPILLASLGPYNFRQLFVTGEESERQNVNNLWASGLGLWGDQEEKAGFPSYDFSITTGTIGYDYTFPSRVTLGAAVSKGSIDVDLANNTGDGSIDTFSGMLYGSYCTSAAYVEGALSYGQNSYESNRLLTIGSIRRTAASEHDGDVYSAYLGGGYFFQFGNWSVGPTAAMRYLHLDEEGFAESGAGSVNLTVDGRQTQSLVSEVSLRAAGAVKTS